MLSGIYKITNINNNKCYIGSAKDIDKRLRVHKSLLKSNKHHSIKLQRSYNKGNKFKFEKLVNCPEEYLIKLEQWFINHYKSFGEGYNMNPKSSSRLGVKTSIETREKQRQIKLKNPNRYWLGKKRPDIGKKISKSIKENGNSMLGKNHSLKTKILMRELAINRKSYLSLIGAKKVKERPWLKKRIRSIDIKNGNIMEFNSVMETADYYKVKRTTISRLVAGNDIKRSRLLKRYKLEYITN